VRNPDELTQRFRERGLKVTPQRQAVFRALYDDHTHPTAESVYGQVSAHMPTISLRTVYQTLNDLADMGEILHLELGTGSARFDANVEDPHHHHLVCDGCGMVRDVSADVGSIRVHDGLPPGFRVSGTDIVVRGRCEACAAA
jgi:Fur family transcriptional regulator, stress-responsive regulator